MSATLDWNPAEAAWAAAVLLHPHPDFGGDRHNHVIDALYHALPRAGISTARFDFASSDADAAAAQAVEAVAHIASKVAGPVFLIGYSFGADIATVVADERVAGWVLVAPPLRAVPAPAATVIATDGRPKLVLAAEYDQFSAPGRTRHLTAGWAATTFAVVDGADHFLNGEGAAVVRAASDWLAGFR